MLAIAGGRCRVPWGATSTSGTCTLSAFQNRDRVLEELQAAGVGAGIHYPAPVHLTGAYDRLGYAAGAFPVAERASRTVLSLPLFAEITLKRQERVVSVLRTAVR